MKNILLATTALVASTSFALAAEVSLGGFAEMGVVGGEVNQLNEDDNANELVDRDGQFHTDVDVDFSLSGETDGGLTFGAEVDLDSTQEGGAFVPSEGGDDSYIYVSGAYGNLSMGDTDGALDFVMKEAIIGGTIDDVNEHAGYNGNSGLDGTYDGQVARYDYSFGAFSFAASAEIDDDSDSADADLFDDFEAAIDDIEDDTVLGVGVRYEGEFGGFGFGAGLGYQQTGDSDVIGLSLDMATAGGITAILNYSDYDNVPLSVGTFDNDSDAETDQIPFNAPINDHIGLALGYEVGAILVAVNYGVYDTTAGDVTGYALTANYDLGGGAELQAGYAHADYDDINDFEDTDNYSFGIRMNF
ncbi:porin [Maribius pontilimi]|uniref:Porin n=1 Tax=Palleronia pontilimi TaxID=1964209 RepID=A0A934MEA3_9RHOB|nr:porin [Palleronia pontilimi]MBJ3763246.1 porin [Palleronia pontilimi]